MAPAKKFEWITLGSVIAVLSIVGTVWGAASAFQSVKARVDTVEKAIIDQREDFKYLRSRVDEINSKLPVKKE